MRFAHFTIVVGGALASTFVAFACSFPDYVAVDAVDDAGVDSIEADVADTTPVDTGPLVTCDDAAVAGSAVSCACGGGDEAGVDATDETGEAGAATGFRACMVDGAFATTCGGCVDSCEGVTAPTFATCVPGGVVHVGGKNAGACPPSGCALELPEHPAALSRFFLDDHEVTVGRFRAWWSAGHVTPNAGDAVFTAGDGTKVTWKSSFAIVEPTKNDGSAATKDMNWLGDADATNDARPINGVTWATALAFCMANGARLPTETEWEAAASGRADRLFPWSDDGTKTQTATAAMIPCVDAISAASGASCGAPISSALAGFSADGAFDLAGSLAEWTLDVAPNGGAACGADCWPSTPVVDPVAWNDAITLHAVRGGSYVDTDPKRLRAQARDFAAASTATATIGFRCASR